MPQRPPRADRDAVYDPTDVDLITRHIDRIAGELADRLTAAVIARIPDIVAAVQRADHAERAAAAQRRVNRLARSPIAPGPDLDAPAMTEVRSAINSGRDREHQLAEAERGHPLLRPHGGTRADGTALPRSQE